MKTKITIKDIAKEAGVSVATVSYVLNNKTEERISEETRKKVLQIINLLGYTPNQSAKALATNRSRNIAVYLPGTDSPLKRAEQLHFTDLLTQVLKDREYCLIHLNADPSLQIDNADAIICYDTPRETFSLLGDRNFIPLLACDCRIDDPLFFQVLSDYGRVKEQADAYFEGRAYVMAALETLNAGLNTHLDSLFSDRAVIRTLRDLNSLSGKRVLVTEDTLYRLLKEECELLYVPAVTALKLEKLLECMELAVKRVPIADHNIIVS